MGAMALTPRTEPWSDLLQAGRADERLVREAFEGAREPELRPIPADLHPAVRAGLERAGIDALYSHQAEALEAAWAGPTIVTTGTASGKSLCFNLPTLDVLCGDARARALYLYPTKALAQDQARALNGFGLAKQVRPAIYDGDTKREERAAIRRRSNLVLTNPDMLHIGILPNHGAWGDFFANLAVVVVDEAHVYRGVFGAHVANVLRRLRRVAGADGTEPRVLFGFRTGPHPVALGARAGRRGGGGWGGPGAGREPGRGPFPLPPRSPPGSNWRSGSLASMTFSGCSGTARRARGGRSRCGTRRSSTRRCRSGAARWRRRPRWWPSSCGAVRGRSASSSRARRSSSSRGWRGWSSRRTPSTPTSPSASRRTAPATRRSSGASSRHS